MFVSLVFEYKFAVVRSADPFLEAAAEIKFRVRHPLRSRADQSRPVDFAI
jgi:hypothetical protein